MLRNYQSLQHRLWGYIYKCNFSIKNELFYLCKRLNISEAEANYLCMKYPVVRKLNDSDIKSLLHVLHSDLGYKYPVKILMEEPIIFAMLPVTIKYRHEVLRECGFINISSSQLAKYLTIVKQKKIRELKGSGEIPDTLNVENRLASCLTQWPTSLTTLIYGDVNNFTFYELRLKIMQRYLELVLDLNNIEFYRGIKTYPTMKHRPLKTVNETLTILQSQIMIPPEKIKANLYLIHADAENLKKIIYKFRSIGGIDIKEIIRMYPKIAMKNYSSLVEIRNIMQEYEIDNEAQTRCFEIYTLGPSTIKERLEKSKKIPEISTYFNHPRFLKIIYYNNTAMKRLMTLYKSNKKCSSLNILSGSLAHYETYEKAPGDRLGKGKDLIFCISQCLNNAYNSYDIRNIVKKHPFWINIPLVQVKFVFEQLAAEYSHKDIYQNCTILLYPWNKIKEVLQLFDRKKKSYLFHEHLHLDNLSKAQKLSLVLYLLEKNHYFSGNGVWTEEKSKMVNTPNSSREESIP